VERAGGYLGSKEGVFSPAALNNSAKAMDSTLRKRGFARGKALMQDYATRGENVLGNTIPDSGTPIRSAVLAALAGGLSHNPLLAAPMIAGAAGGLLYSKPVQSLATGLLASRPVGAEVAAGLTRRFAPVVASDAAPYLLGQR
jgi:hypothetical protein